MHIIAIMGAAFITMGFIKLIVAVVLYLKESAIKKWGKYKSQVKFDNNFSMVPF